MVDSANILMQQYQGIISRLPPMPMQVVPPNPDTTAQRVPVATDATDAAAAAPAPPGAAAAAVPASASAPVCDKPSTSKAAKSEAKPHEGQVNSVAISSPVANASEKVTIEDLGAEEDINPSTDSASVDVDSEESSELSELRKRRLKFLEERNKSPTTTSDKTD